MIEDSLILKSQHLDYEMLLSHLRETSDEFYGRSDDFICNYARKLSDNASFVTVSNIDGEICALTAYYVNSAKFVYISHVWVSKSCRGGASAAK